MRGLALNSGKFYLYVAVIFLAVFLFELAFLLPKCRASEENFQALNLYQKQATGFQLKVSLAKKTDKSSIKINEKTGKYFTVIISVNGQVKSTLTAKKNGKFKTSIPLIIGTNTITIQASSSDGSIIKNVTKIITRTRKKAKNNATYQAQLQADINAYNSAKEKLTRDYNYAVDMINAKALEEGAYKIDPNCAEEQRCQIIQRKYAKYEVELNYLAETYEADLKAIEATKYW
jgi:hypothetical protein